MKIRKLSLLSLLAVASTSLSGCSLNDFFGGNKVNEDNAHITEYYSSINENAEGTTLLNSLRQLNLSKRTSQVGYSVMGTSSSGKFKFTDYDPATEKVNKDGVKYGTKILSFYSGISTYSFNREHVWPKSRGGDNVEDDIFMTRPTITEENSNRGNSPYVTGMVTEHNGWDPVTAFGNNIGNYTNIRGECARIIFYCMTATDKLVLNDSISNSSNNMSKISDLVVWSLENPVNDREKRRNDGGEYLQGNRNAFVDHPEYVCKIWGRTNSATKKACGLN